MIQQKIIYAGRLERLFANLIDTIILIFPSMLIASMLQGTDLGLLAAFACSAAYYTFFTASSWQATPGKRLLGIHVIRTDGRWLTSRDTVERFLAYTLPSLPIYASFIPQNVAPMLVFWLSLLWFVPILTTPERTGLHDRLCRTRVVVGKLSR